MYRNNIYEIYYNIIIYNWRKYGFGWLYPSI